MKNWKLWAIVAAVLAAAVAGTVARQVEVRERPGKETIISLAPSVTEILFALGLKDRIIGISTACDYPPDTKDVRKVGDFGAPKIELIYALKPELVITTDLRDPEAANAIERSGAKLLILRQRSLDDVLDAIGRIGDAARVPDAARSYAQQLKARIARASPTVPDADRPRVFLEISERPLCTAGQGSFLDELIERAGGRNIAHDLPQLWPTISPESVVERNPEIIIVAHPIGGDARTALANRIGWSGIAALQSGHVVADMNLDLLLRPGPRLADGLEALSTLFAQYRERRPR